MPKASSRRLVIVESPTKAASISRFLGKDYVVVSSVGHIRDLPTGASEIPAKYKGEKWARTGVNIDADFAPLYVVSAGKKTVLRELKSELVNADELYLATDEDREGEAIAWHLLAELKPKIPSKRMVFHEITEEAIKAAVEQTRELDTDLVDAQETRRILDRLYGYEVSPVLWKKIMPKLSAGRVQSVATRLLVDREKERIDFRSAEYCDVEAVLGAEAAEPPKFEAKVVQFGANRIATGRDFDSVGKLTKENLLHLDQAGAQQLADALPQASFTVSKVEAKAYTRRPYAPFRTTTLQQEAGRKLGFSAQRTMSVAQELYERGFITYMRTDSVNLADQAVASARKLVKELFGSQFLPAKPRQYASKVKNAQEAHEAIRPAGDFQPPNLTGLSGDQLRLYELIWKRTIASQMKDAEGQTVSVSIAAAWREKFPIADVHNQTFEADAATISASGRTLTFTGFLAAYVESVEDDQSSDDEQASLPALTVGQTLSPVEFKALAHQTKPPARYTEPSLVAKLENLEIGRPSTYAAIIRTITARDYVFKKGQALIPTWLAFAVTRLLEEYFPKLVDYHFTALMEETLDEIANGNASRLKVLTDFYFGDGGLKELVGGFGEIDAQMVSRFQIDEDTDLRVGRYGTYIENKGGQRANIDPELPPDELTSALAKELLDRPVEEARVVGVMPDSGDTIVAKEGRFGPYVTQVLPDDAPKSAKPKTASLFKSMTPQSVTLEQALALLSLPRVLGKASDGEEITAQNGRYGPYLKKGNDSRSLESEEQIFSITLPGAEAIYAQPKVRGRSAAAGPLRELGADPATGKPVVVKDGRFGPYVTDGETNATLRRTDSVSELTLERAADLLAEKRARPPRPAPARRARKAK
ncbi:MAG: type I DNA topoisomerase [Propionibacteriaceae bacterium]|nr:type I DNA topoisomerase [Propionibacteriaceae bacterium]